MSMITKEEAKESISFPNQLLAASIVFHLTVKWAAHQSGNKTHLDVYLSEIGPNSFDIIWKLSVMALPGSPPGPAITAEGFFPLNDPAKMDPEVLKEKLNLMIQALDTLACTFPAGE